MKIVCTIKEIQKATEELRRKGKVISVVPTMGYLHKGHLSLIEYARSNSDVVITTIFVNPKQFGVNEDYKRYPRNFEHDKELAKNSGTDILFYPQEEEMYPKDFSTYVEVEGISNILEGEFRPNHFRGVTTVVTKLLNVTQPNKVIFGQKDAQQAFIIKRLIKDLNFNIDLIVKPIVREPDGLALSSRNVYLNTQRRKDALVLYKSLIHAEGRIKGGERSIGKIKDEMMTIINSGNPTKIDYISFVKPNDFSIIDRNIPDEVLILLAVRFNETRLIDNIILIRE